MRIIRGLHKGRKIKVPGKFTERPTTDFAKEALFNILENEYRFSELKVLDLFAGTGGISYEFLSRGVPAVTAVERVASYAEFIRRQGEELFPTRLNVRAADAFKFAEQFTADFDLIFADPPYQLERIKELPNIVFSNSDKRKKRLSFILEHSGKINFSKHAFFLKEKKYGKVRFSFFHHGTV